jgi:hypothetical protein
MSGGGERRTMPDAIRPRLERGTPETRSILAAIDNVNMEALDDLVDLARHEPYGFTELYEMRRRRWRERVAEIIESGFCMMQSTICALANLKVEEVIARQSVTILNSVESKTERPSDPPKPDQAG